MDPREVLGRSPGWAAMKGMRHGAAVWMAGANAIVPQVVISVTDSVWSGLRKTLVQSSSPSRSRHLESRSGVWTRNTNQETGEAGGRRSARVRTGSHGGR